MWLPTKLYERLPLIWLIIGLLFFAAAFYMSFAYEWSIWYFGAGVSCCVWAGILFLVRSRREQAPQSGQEPAETAD